MLVQVFILGSKAHYHEDVVHLLFGVWFPILVMEWGQELIAFMGLKEARNPSCKLDLFYQNVLQALDTIADQVGIHWEGTKASGVFDANVEG